jgi:hypothetical protein
MQFHFQWTGEGDNMMIHPIIDESTACSTIKVNYAFRSSVVIL